MKSQFPIRCAWRNGSTDEHGKPDKPNLCKMRKCPGEFRNWKELAEIKCKLFWEEKEEVENIHKELRKKRID